MRLRLFLIFALVIAITLAGVAVFARQTTANEVRMFVNRGGAIGVDDFVTTLETYYAEQGSWQGVEDVFPHQGQGRSNGAGQGRGQGSGQGIGSELVLVDAAGRVIYGPTDLETGTQVDIDAYGTTIPLHAKADVIGYLLVANVTTVPNFEDNLLQRLDEALVKAAMIAAGLALVLAVILAYLLLRPVRQLTQAATRLSEGDLSQRVAVSGRDELATLGKTFNQMAASLEDAQATRQAMTADIAHELRTPLAVQQAHLEALQDGVYSLELENLEPIIDQNHLLARLVNDLRTLALADAGELTLECVETDVAGLVARTAGRFQPQAAQKGIQVEIDVPENCPQLEADAARLQQIVNNLLQNALQHTPQDGHITVNLRCSGESLALSVRDSGPGIPAEALPHVFERFYRADRGRSRVDGGTGLGLAIARKLAEAHGGQLTAGNHAAGGAEFQMVLPVGRGKN
ncbi:MAG: HAMP domain-containing protein [Anaerolineales bacterium]|nr:HAMP domain-containing protein [Anaerolineales bacterium]